MNQQLPRIKSVIVTLDHRLHCYTVTSSHTSRNVEHICLYTLLEPQMEGHWNLSQTKSLQISL